MVMGVVRKHPHRGEDSLVEEQEHPVRVNKSDIETGLPQSSAC